MERAFKEAEKGSLGHFKQIHRLIEEDSISTQTRVALTAEASNGKEVCPHCGRGPKMSTERLLETIRAIYGLGSKKNQKLPRNRRGDNPCEMAGVEFSNLRQGIEQIGNGERAFYNVCKILRRVKVKRIFESHLRFKFFPLRTQCFFRSRELALEKF